MKWSLYNDLQKSNGAPDLEKLVKINKIFDALPPQQTHFTFSDAELQELVGYTAHIRIEATPYFTGDIAVSTLTVKFSGSGNSEVKVKNTFAEYRFKRALDNDSP